MTDPMALSTPQLVAVVMLFIGVFAALYWVVRNMP